jgi:hypothetical protein
MLIYVGLAPGNGLSPEFLGLRPVASLERRLGEVTQAKCDRLAAIRPVSFKFFV